MRPGPAPAQPTPAAPSTAQPSPLSPTLNTTTALQLQSDTSGSFSNSFFTKPGATSAGISPETGRPVLRGLGDSKVRVQENGVGTTDVSDIAQDHAIPIDPLSVQRTEIIRGPAALKFGSQAVGGVVEATNNRIPTAVPVGGVAAETRLGVTSVNSGFETGMLMDAGSRDFAVHADVYGRQAADYRIPAYPYLVPPDPAPAFTGRQPNSRLTAEGAAIGGSYLLDNGYAGVSISRYTGDFYIPGIATSADRQHNVTQQTKISSKGEFGLDIPLFTRLRYWLGHSDYRHDETLGTRTITATFRNTQNEARAELETLPIPTLLGITTAIVGAQGVTQKLNTRGDAILQPALTLLGAGYVFTETRHTDTFRTQLAGRIESVSVRGTAVTFSPDNLPPPDEGVGRPAERVYTPKSVSFSAIQDLPEFLVASLTAQRIERAPRNLELYASGPDGSERTFKIGNADLKIETANTIEGGLSRVGGDFRFDAKAYYTRYDNFIFAGQTGNFCGETFATCAPGLGSGEFIQVAYGQRDAIFRGAEIAAQWLLFPLAGGSFGIDGQYDFVRATFTDGGNVPRIPPMRIGGGAFWRDNDWSVRLGLVHAYAQNDFERFDTRTPGYDILKFELERRTVFPVSPWGPIELTTGFVADNLLDSRIRNSVQFHKDEILAPGRAFKGFINVKYASLGALQGGRPRRFLLDDSAFDDDSADRGFRWDGPYAGLNAGYHDSSVRDRTFFSDETGEPAASARRVVSRDGAVGGVQAGYNWVVGPLLVGVEGDIQFSGGDRALTRRCAGGVCGGALTPPDAAVTSGLAHGLFGSLRGRLGALVTPDVLPYFTLGVPVGAVTKAGTVALSDADGNPVVASFANSPIKAGLTIGAGVEAHLFGAWTGRIEYLRSDFSNSSAVPAAPVAGTAAVGYASSLTENVVRVGLNYQFSSGRW